MRKSQRQITIQASLLEFFFWFAMSTFTSFTVSTLISFGWPQSQAALVMTVGSLTSLAAQPILGYIVDRFLTEKKLVLLGLTGAALVILLFPIAITSGSEAAVFAAVILFNLCGGQMAGFIDAWVVGLKQEYPELNYGLIRGMGSGSFAISAILNGRLSVLYGMQLKYYMGSVFFIIAVFVASRLQTARKDITGPAETSDPTSPETQEKLSAQEAIHLVFHQKPYRLLLFVSFFTFLCSSPLMTLLQIVILDLDGDLSIVGTTMFINAMSELPAMYLIGRIMYRYPKPRLLFIAGLGYTLRMLLTGTVNNLGVLIGIQALQAISYGIFVPTSMSYLSEIIDSRVRSTSITVYSAISMSLSSILGNLLATRALALGYSAQQVIRFFAVFAFTGTMLTLYGKIKKVWE